MAGEQFSLCWDNFHKNMSSGMHSLLESEDLVDVTLAIEGKYLKAHKMVLSVCSPYFRELFQMNPCKHPIVFMKDVSYTAMNDLLTFMYQGEVQVNQEQLTTFIKTAEALQIKGLTSDGNNETTEIPDDHPEEVPVTKIPSASTLHENDVISKPVQKPKKSVTHPPAKRQRISSPASDKPSSVNLKTDATTTDQPQSTEQLIQFKMEPYEADQSDQTQMESFEENPDDTFGDDGVDDSHMDDTDYSMLKGEEEPQAGTSGDGMGESQVCFEIAPAVKTKKRKPTPQKVIHKGFVYHLRLQHHGKTRYFRCAKERYTGCTATAKLDINVSSENLKVIRPHNHPPDTTIEVKVVFENQLRKAVQNMTNMDNRSIYNLIATIYPESAEMFPFGPRLNCKMKRWRRSYLEG